jgi:hypothetical protein
MCVCNCALNKLDPGFKVSEFKEVAPAETKRSKAGLSIVARSNPERSNAESRKFVPGESSEQTERPVDHRLFNWITILLLTGWILVVGVAANTAEVPKSLEAPTIQAFIEDLI